MTTVKKAAEHKATLIHKEDKIYQYRGVMFAKNAQSTSKEDRWTVAIFEKNDGKGKPATNMAEAKLLIDDYIAAKEAEAVAPKKPRTAKDKKSQLAAIMGHETVDTDVEVAQSIAQTTEKSGAKKVREKTSIEALAEKVCPDLNIFKGSVKDDLKVCRVYMSSDLFGSQENRSLARDLASKVEAKLGVKIMVSYYKVNSYISLVDQCMAGYVFCVAFQRALDLIPTVTEDTTYNALTALNNDS